MVPQKKDNLILSKADRKIDEFNRIGLHYNLVAKEIYRKRRSCGDPFSQSFMQYIIAGLISFDMGRMMGKVEEAYDFNKGFGSRLNRKVSKIRANLEQVTSLSVNLTEIDLRKHEHNILNAYRELSDDNKDALNKNGHFYVGATKILHFLNPELFIIVDSYATKAFQKAHGVTLEYSSERYLERMRYARQDIREFGLEQFKALEKDTPITRIYDKLTFMTGKEILEGGER